MGRESSETTLHLAIASDEDLLAARSQIRAAALEMGFATTDMVRIVTAVSELARNILLYAGRGELSLRVINENGRDGVLITAQDEGPGIRTCPRRFWTDSAPREGWGWGCPGHGG